MDIKTRNEELEEISKEIFGDGVVYQIVKPGELELIKQNARYFKKEIFKQLVNNIKKDKRLSSVPLCIKQGEKIMVLSGNHRVKAAIQAGIEYIMVMVIIDTLKESKKIAIQLSHNAIVGEDDVNVLADLWAKIKDIKDKLYTGISSDLLKELEDIKFITFTTPSISTKSISFLFTVEEKEKLDQVLEDLKRIASQEVVIFPLTQFEAFFKLIQDFKKSEKIKNGSLAMVKMIDVISEYLEGWRRKRRFKMSFVGAITADTRRVLADFVKYIRTPVLVIGAGNFTIPSVLRSAGFKGVIKACDVTLYTSLLGAYLTGSDIKISLNTDCPDYLKELVWLNTTLDAAASASLLYDLREVWKRKNPFQERAVDQYIKNWADLMQSTRERLKKYRQHLGNLVYWPKDGFDVLQEEEKNQTIITAPPTYKMGYEKLDALLRLVFNWQPPQYRPILDKEIDIYKLIEPFKSYFVVLYKDMPEVNAVLGEPSVVILPKRGSSTLYIIVKKPQKQLVLRPYVKSETIGAPAIPPEKKITGNEVLTFSRLTLNQSIRMNELYASARVDTFTGGVSESLLFLLDGRVLGKADFCPSSFNWKIPGEDPEVPMIYLMSDLVVPNCTPRLTKLVLLALLSKDVKALIDTRFTKDFKFVLTTAFTPHPISMKYRGVFKLHKRLDDKAAGAYRLNYYAPFGDHALSETIAIWKGKHLK